jgi:hypothetical protein
LWPKSARWLWRRIKEVLSVLVAASIEASRRDGEKATEITLRKLPKNDSSNSSDGESGRAKPNPVGIKYKDDSRSNSSLNSREKPLSYADSGITGDTALRNGDSSEAAEGAEEHSWDCLCDGCVPA